MESLEMAKHWFESKSPDLSEGSISTPITPLTPLYPKHRETSETPLITKNDRSETGSPFLSNADRSKEDQEFENLAKRDAVCSLSLLQDLSNPTIYNA